jgi:geranylgeranyl diphosphate synthase, type I
MDPGAGAARRPAADTAPVSERTDPAPPGPPDPGTPDTGTPDTGTPDTGTPDTAAPDTGTPDLAARVTAALRGFLDGCRGELAGMSADLLPPADAVAEFVLGAGKRLRPAFAYWGWRGAGQPDRPQLVHAVASLELLQACALIHDDVIDGSQTRRGRPSVHRRFGALHRGAGWAGSAERFGVASAILLGDMCLTWSFRMLRQCGLDPAAVQRAMPVHEQMCTEVTAGQYLDVLAQAQQATDVDTALRVIRLKTAKYTVERPLHLGGALAGCGPELAAAYTGYGLPVGEAFQLRDDLLGVFGDPAVTGKPAGDDLREGKRTVLIALAAGRAGAAQRALLDRLLGDPVLPADGVAALREMIAGTGAVAEVERMIAERVEAGMAALAAAPLDPTAAAALADLAVAATARTG